MSAQNLGSLFVTLDARTTGWLRKFDEATRTVDKFTKEVKKLAADVAQTSTAVTALGVAAVAMASTVDGRTSAAMKNVTGAMQLLATQVSDLLGPALRELADLFRQLAGFVANLDPETKKSIAGWAVLAVQIGVAAKIVGVVFGLLNGLAGAVNAAAGAIAAFGAGPLLALVLGLAAAAVAIAVLHAAWRTYGQQISDVVQKVAQFFADSWNKAIEFVEGAFRSFVDTIAGLMKSALAIMAEVAERTGKTGAAGAIRLAMGVIDNVAKDLKAGASARKFIAAAIDLGKETAAAFVAEWEQIADRLGLKDAFNKLKAAWQGAQGGAGARAPVAATKPVGDWYGKFSDDLNAKTVNRIGKLGGGAVWEGKASQAAANEMELKARQAADQAAQAMGDSMIATAQNFVGKLGTVGGIANSVIQAAQAGGPWAALAAGLAGLLAETGAFSRLVDSAAGGLKVITDALEPAAGDLLGALGSVLAPVFQAIASAITAVSPILNVVAQVVRRLAPILVLVGYFLQMLGPLFNLLAVILQPVIAVLEVLMRVLFEIARVIFTVVGAVATAIVAIWNALLDAIAAIVDTVIAVLTAGTIRNAGDFVRQGKASTKAFDDALLSMTVTSYDAAMATANKAAADQAATKTTEEATKAVQEFSESFLNVPSGYKVSAARFAATAESSSGYGGAGGGTMIVIGSVDLAARDPQEFARRMEAVKQQTIFRSTGSFMGQPKNLR